MVRPRLNRCAAFFAALAILLPPRLAVADPADFYRGKTVDLLVGFSTGGGYDAYARAVARVLGNHIPGKPQVVVKNFVGAGSLRLALYLQGAAPRDGLAFGTFDNLLLVSPLVKQGINFNPSKLSWVGTASTDLQVCLVWNGANVKSIEDMQKANSVFGATGRDDIRYISIDVLRKLTGASVKIVSGYPGTSEIRLALEKSEIDGECESWQSMKATKPDWIRDRKAIALVQFALERDPELSEVPLIIDYARSSEEREALKLIFSSSEAGRPFAGPPGIPADRLGALRRAFDATLKDPEFLEIARKQNLDLNPRTGERAEEFLGKTYSSPQSVVDIARNLLND